MGKSKTDGKWFLMLGGLIVVAGVVLAFMFDNNVLTAGQANYVVIVNLIVAIAAMIFWRSPSKANLLWWGSIVCIIFALVFTWSISGGFKNWDVNRVIIPAAIQLFAPVLMFIGATRNK